MFIIILAVILFAFIIKVYNLVQEIITIYYQVGKNKRDRKYKKVFKNNSLKILLFTLLLASAFAFILYLQLGILNKR